MACTHAIVAVREACRLESVLAGHKVIELLRFRHQIFRDELRWLEASVDGLDRDEYDAWSDLFGVFCLGRVVGSVRITPGTERFMLEHDFQSLLPAGQVLHKSCRSAEITRLAVAQDAAGRRMDASSRLLYFCLYQWACQHRVRWMYFVVEPVFFKLIRRLGFPAYALGAARRLRGGVLSQAGFLDWDLAGVAFIDWLQSGISVPAQAPARLREYDYSH